MATHSASLTFCHSTTRLHSTATDRCAAIATPVACTRRATTPARHPANAMLARCGALTIPTTFNRKLSPAAPLTRASARRNVRAAFMGETVELYNNGVFDFKQSKTIKRGDKLPLDDESLTLLQLSEGGEPQAVKLRDVVAGKKVVLFGLPGAYTSICSSKHVPQYNERADELKAQGVDSIVCLSVNDPWVMAEWGKNLNVDPNRVALLADGEGLVHSRLGLLQHMPGLGVRAIRYSMLVDDGTVVVLNIEEPGGKSYKTSGPGHMLEDIAALNKGQQG